MAEVRVELIHHSGLITNTGYVSVWEASDLIRGMGDIAVIHFSVRQADLAGLRDVEELIKSLKECFRCPKTKTPPKMIE